MRKLLSTDGYKLSHFEQYPKSSLSLYGNITARSDKHFHQRTVLSDHKYVVYGIWQAMKTVEDIFDKEFFDQPFHYVIDKVEKTISNYTNFKPGFTEALEKLHGIGYLPITVRSVPEGMSIPIGMPCMTILSDDILLFSFLEPVITSLVWKAITNATTAREYHKVGKHWANLTSDNPSFVSFQFHDFSSRGMCGPEDMGISGSAHLVVFSGTESVSALNYVEDMYGWDYNTDGPLAATIEATEHSVASSNIMYEQAVRGCDLEEAELHYLRRYITEVYPAGMVAYVADTFDFFRTVSQILPKLKDEILARDGKLVIRPDSFEPVEGLCGMDLPFITDAILLDMVKSNNTHSEIKHYRTLTEMVCVHITRGNVSIEKQPMTNEQIGTIPLLWSIFGGTENSKGYKELDSHIGVIYGDGINTNVAHLIFSRLEGMGFASTNLVVGVGAGSYQWISRDTLGIAYKATHLRTDDVGPIDIYKDPVGSFKKSAKGLLGMKYFAGEWVFQDGVTEEEERMSDMVTVFDNGTLFPCTFSDIRKRFADEN